jgi:hypothetical protein
MSFAADHGSEIRSNVSRTRAYFQNVNGYQERQLSVESMSS